MTIETGQSRPRIYLQDWYYCTYKTATVFCMGGFGPNSHFGMSTTLLAHAITMSAPHAPRLALRNAFFWFHIDIHLLWTKPVNKILIPTRLGLFDSLFNLCRMCPTTYTRVGLKRCAFCLIHLQLPIKNEHEHEHEHDCARFTSIVDRNNLIAYLYQTLCLGGNGDFFNPD